MAATVLESPVRVRVFSQGATVLVGIVLFFHGVEGLLDLIAPTDAPSRFLFGLTLFAGSLFLLVVNRGFVAASGIEADDDAADAVAPAGIVHALREVSPIPCCCLVDFHADVWAVATVNGASLCCAWAGLEHVLDSAPRLLMETPPPAWVDAFVCLVLGNFVLVASRQLGNQFRTRLGLSAAHVLEKTRRHEPLV